RELRYQHAAEIYADLKRLKRDSDTSIPAARPASASGRSRVQGRKEAGILRLAVLPFEDTNSSPDTEFLSEGITENLIATLSQIPNLRVISRTSVFRYKGQPIDPQAIGHELDVGALLVGRMTTRGDSLSVSLELIDPRDNSCIWGGRFNRKLAELVTLEEE